MDQAAFAAAILQPVVEAAVQTAAVRRSAPSAGAACGRPCARAQRVGRRRSATAEGDISNVVQHSRPHRFKRPRRQQPCNATEYIQRNDQMNEHEVEENSDVPQRCPSDKQSDDYSLDSKMASQNQYYGRWAAEKWLLRVYLRRCCRFLLSRVRTVKTVDTSGDKLPF